MLFAVIKLVIGLVLTSVGADAFVKGAASLAYRLGISPLIVGLTVVAFGTSAPELLVCVQAALSGSPSLAIGNAVGSNIFNTAAILGISALLFPIACSIGLIRREVPIMIGVGGLLVGLILLGGDSTLSRFDGVVLLSAFVLYIVLTYRLALRERKADLVAANLDDSDVEITGSVGRDALYILVGAGLLVFGADLMVTGAVSMARLYGISELIIGLTIVGAGTGLPELATSVAAAIRKQSDIAVGNVVGSNIFNVLLILGTTATIVPVTVESAILTRDLPVMMFLFVLCFPMMVTRRTIGRAEGAFLLTIYVGYIAFLIAAA